MSVLLAATLARGPGLGAYLPWASALLQGTPAPLEDTVTTLSPTGFRFSKVDAVAVWKKLILQQDKPQVTASVMQYLTDRVHGRPAQTTQGNPEQPVTIQLQWSGTPEWLDWSRTSEGYEGHFESAFSACGKGDKATRMKGHRHTRAPSGWLPTGRRMAANCFRMVVGRRLAVG